MAGPEVFVELQGITRQYIPHTAALADVDLVIHRGESIAIIGRSGSGKSTLLNILGLLDKPDAGVLLIDGQAVDLDSDRRRSERRRIDLGFVFQRSHLIPNLTARANVMLALRYYGWPETVTRAHAEQALVDVGLAEKVDAVARTLSGGEMQRVAIARTMARPARLWLADEPTGNLDSSQSEEIITMLKARAAERGACLVVVTHEPDIARQLDRTITLLDGRIIADTTLTGDLPDSPPLAAGAGESSTSPPPLAGLVRTTRFVLQALVAHPRRAWSGTLAVAVAVALTVAALGLGQSASAQVTSLFNARRANQVTATVESPAQTSTPRPLRIADLSGSPGVTSVEYWRLRQSAPMSNGPLATTSADVIQVDQAPGRGTDSTVRWAATDDETLGSGEVVLGAVLADRLGVAQVDLQPEITVAGSRLVVVGLLTSSRSGNAAGAAFVATTTELALPPAVVSSLFVETVPGAARGIADQLARTVDPYATTTITLDPVVRADAYRGQLEASVSASLSVLSAVASLAGLIAVIFVNILNVSARTAEFGVRRAFGARRSELVSLVVGESTILGVLGAALGVVAGFLAIMIVTIVARWQPVFDLRLLLIGLVGAVVFGTAGGLAPAIAAGRIQPADAVRS